MEEKTKTNRTEVVTLQQAIKELRAFIYFHDELKVGKLEDDDVLVNENNYIISAIQKGLLTIENNIPTYTLLKPIGEGDISVDKINFRTRIKPMDNARITQGLDISKNQFEYILRCNCFLTGQSKGIYNSFEKYDLKVIEQICSIFL